MRVFLSWSGCISRELATLLHEWIPLVIQCAKPFMSTGDIDKGRRWSDVLSQQLSESDYGIVCVTRENYTAPWLHFEAGAISKAIDKSYVSPLLFDIGPSEISKPLQQFQLTICTKADILDLMRSINSRLCDYRLDDDVLIRVFDKWWPELDVELTKLRKKKDVRSLTSYEWLYMTNDLFTRANNKQSRSCVWWITPNPFNYVLRSSIKQSIHKCIERDFNFTFILPDDRSGDASPLIKQIEPDKPDNTRIVPIPDAEFQQEAITDYVVINPDTYLSEVFLALPVATRDYWISVVGEAAGHVAKRFRTLAKRQGEELPSPPAVVAVNTA